MSSEIEFRGAIGGNRKRERLLILEEEAEIESAYRLNSEKDFLCFSRGITIESSLGPRVFENCMAGFQRVCFEEIAPSLHDVRYGRMPEIRRWWIERTKKASKDADLAIIMLWLLAFPVRPLYMQVGAADREQASIVKERMLHLLHWNPWLNDHVELVSWEARSKKLLSNGSHMARMNIMSSDIAGSHGGTPDVLIINELSHVRKWEFVENLMDNADGVAQGMVIIATNAGFRGTKAEQWRHNAMKSDEWCSHYWAKPAPWHSRATIAEAKLRNPISRYNRLWMGRWASGHGDALNGDDVDKCFSLRCCLSRPEPGWVYLGGLDLGVSHDHSGLVVLGVNSQEQKIKLAWMKAWEPRKSGEVDLIEVEDVCKSMSQLFRLDRLYYDPHQAKLMAQRLQRAGVPMREMTFSSPTNLTKMATTLLQVVESGKLYCYDVDGRLWRDFGKFNVVEKTYGFRLEAVSDEYGHADVGTALVIALPAAVDLLNHSSFSGEDEMCGVDGVELSEQEISDLPKEFKDIYEAEDDEDFGQGARGDGLFDVSTL